MWVWGGAVWVGGGCRRGEVHGEITPKQTTRRWGGESGAQVGLWAKSAAHVDRARDGKPAARCVRVTIKMRAGASMIPRRGKEKQAAELTVYCPHTLQRRAWLFAVLGSANK